MVEPPGAKSLSTSDLTQSITRTKGKIAKFLSSTNLLAFLYSRLDRPNHHRADTNSHYSTKLGTVDGYNLPYILPINVQRGPNSLRLCREKML